MKTVLIWIPGHAAFKGIEHADKTAKEANKEDKNMEENLTTSYLTR